ncbi:hypothetical protein [Persicobacter diffluens]|uniref:WGR domain-containing protein n=1 Tax=Persicobacter diffluens TaxID=981 RepID=A0AAN5AP21_9BACT|nr:hypothetical protein PEDI_44480 [Persicobacter diffluens]
MIKLYKTIDNELHYWETWDDENNSAIIHWGKVGFRGEVKGVKSGLFSNFRKVVQKEIDKKVNEGYIQFEDSDLTFIEIIYPIDGMGTEEDLIKRHSLESRINELLGWTGLGHVDGGSIGSGTMEVGCEVVDFEIAKRVIEQDLKGSEFEDFMEIKAIDYELEPDMILAELFETVPREVLNVNIVEPENIEERISAVGTICTNIIGVNEASIEFIPNDNPPAMREILSWIWTFRPDLGAEILNYDIEPEFIKLIESYKTGNMDEFWKYIKEK